MGGVWGARCAGVPCRLSGAPPAPRRLDCFCVQCTVFHSDAPVLAFFFGFRLQKGGFAGFGEGFCTPRTGPGRGFMKKSFVHTMLVQMLLCVNPRGVGKKYFAGMEKGCIFASAFAPWRGLLRNGSDRTLKRWEERDSVCHPSCVGGVGGTKTSQEGKAKNNSYNEEFDPGSG